LQRTIKIDDSPYIVVEDVYCINILIYYKNIMLNQYRQYIKKFSIIFYGYCLIRRGVVLGTKNRKGLKNVGPLIKKISGYVPAEASRQAKVTDFFHVGMLIFNLILI
jgi:hypothetical protein